jgi:GTP-binding protein
VPEGQIPLLERPQVVALNKIDVPEARELADFVRPELEERGFRVFEISTVSHEGLRPLTFALGEIVDAHRAELAAAAAAPKERVVIRPRGSKREFEIRVEGGSYGNVYRILVEDELFRLGAVRGSTVVIGPGESIVFDWEPQMSSAAELITSPRGLDSRFDPNNRRTTSERREQYHERMDAKAAARAELEEQRLARGAAAGEDADGEGVE